MTSNNRFSQTTVRTIALRAANRSRLREHHERPYGAPTGAVNLGEAAHIFGANPGSARYDETMSSSARSAITNAIWLCGNCHKKVDDDPSKFPAGLLFEWQRHHERVVGDLVGKPGADLRDRYEKRHLEEFGRLSYLAERILLEKGGFWEYALMAEVLRFEMRPVLTRWSALKSRLYIRPYVAMPRADMPNWYRMKLAELTSIVAAFSGLMNGEIQKSFGEPGIPGDDTHIVEVGRLFVEMCERALDWEESVRFIFVDDVYQEIVTLFVGIAGRFIDEAAKLQTFLDGILSQENPAGTHALTMTVEFPDGWNEQFSEAVERAVTRIEDGDY